jgi:hypothetical protein
LARRLNTLREYSLGRLPRMINKISKCIIVFAVGVTLSLASLAFFNQIMAMPQQAMTMGSMMVIGAEKPCDCRCPKPN